MDTLATYFKVWLHFDANWHAVICFMLYEPKNFAALNMQRKILRGGCWMAILCSCSAACKNVISSGMLRHVNPIIFWSKHEILFSLLTWLDIFSVNQQICHVQGDNELCFLSVCLSVVHHSHCFLSVCLLSVCRSWLSTCVSFYLSVSVVFQPLLLSVCLYVCMSVCL